MRLARATSLTRRMLVGIGLPMILVALALGIGGALVIGGVVESVNDRLLGASARSIAETIALEEGSVTLDLPASALGMLENDERDNVYYSVSAGGHVLTGYRDLALVRQVPQSDGDAAFEYALYRGVPIRIAAVTRKVPRVGPLVVIQVAETLEARHALRDRLLAALSVLELVLIALFLLLLPWAVRWGLAPLSRVLSEIEGRQRADFTPLALEYVPHELHGLIRAFNRLLGRLDHAVQGIRRFTADASHQMRTPLTILRTHVDVLRKIPLAAGSQQQSVADIDAATRRLQRLLTQLLALARAEGSRDAVVVRRRSVDLVAVARNVALEYAPQAVRQAIDLQFDAPQGAVNVLTQQDLAAELIGNLIDNAIRYNRAGGTVEVRVSIVDGYGSVTVEDEGCGIAAADRALAFERFQRLGGESHQIGTGLGLAIVKALAEGLGAEVSLGDRAGRRGLRVEVLFPFLNA